MGDWWETNRISHAVYNVQSRTLEGGGRTKEKAYRLHSFRPINTNRRRSMLTELPRQKSRSPRPSTPRTSRQQSSLQKLPKLLVKQGQSSSVVTGHADWHAGLYRRGNNNANRTTKLDNKRKVNAMFQEKTFNVSTPKTKLPNLSANEGSKSTLRELPIKAYCAQIVNSSFPSIKPKPQMRLMAESIKEDFKETQGIHEQTFSEKRRRSQKKIELMRYMYYKSEINRAIYLRCCMSIPNNRFIDEPVFMNETNNYDRIMNDPYYASSLIGGHIPKPEATPAFNSCRQPHNPLVSRDVCKKPSPETQPSKPKRRRSKGLQPQPAQDTVHLGATAKQPLPPLVGPTRTNPNYWSCKPQY
ncbi:uncharacterized protein LOC112567117 isoform X2 [Pomacea canaliculata]|uniref:uncharacterized protein LOC112567117 isoform X2 n=1 Tax=Pomacea canaliculata TaxID=400727 RepID=UPI000D7296C6|nr:uncharacterized protein LOC112567117 isoform X2 [Pomacea canaliculata]